MNWGYAGTSEWDYVAKATPVCAGNSAIRKGGPVTFPDFSATRIYMQEFSVVNGLALVDHELFSWRNTINMMLAGTKAEGDAYIMIDQAELKKGEIHRRPGRHIDGAWNAQSTQMLLLASDVLGCVAYVGKYNPTFGLGGDASQIDVSKMRRVKLRPYITYVASPFTTIHESIPVQQDCLRTLVRIHVNQ